MFSTLAARFIASISKHLAQSTVNVYSHYFRKFLEFHRDIPVDSIRPTHINEFASTWHDAQAIKRLFAWAKDEAGLIEENPIAKVKHPPKGQRKRVFTRHELIRFLRNASPDLRSLLIGYRETFARPDELRRAHWEDIASVPHGKQLRDALVSYSAAIVLTDYKDRKRRPDPTQPRVILLSPRLCDLLIRKLRELPNPSGPIFTTASGKAWTANALRCRFRRLRKKLGIVRDRRGENIVPYTFRHTGATEAASKGIRDRILADVLGHTDTSTTRRYQHLANEHVLSAMSSFWANASKRHEKAHATN